MSRPPTIMEVEGQDPKLKKAQNQVSQLKDVMVENVRKVMDRGEHLGRLEEDSEGLRDGAAAFHGRATQLKRQMWWQKCRMQLMVLVVLLVIVLVIVLAACFSNNCAGKK